MKKVIAFLLALPMLLTACGQSVQAGADIQAQYAQVATAEMEADIVYHSAKADNPFTLHCDYDSFSGATTTILAPENLAGISATIGIEGLQVNYQGTALPADDLENVCPANCLPWLMEVLAHGYLQSQGTESFCGTACHRLALESTAMDGSDILCHVWLAQDTLIPLYAEFITDETVKLSVTMDSFSCTLKEQQFSEISKKGE